MHDGPDEAKECGPICLSRLRRLGAALKFLRKMPRKKVVQIRPSMGTCANCGHVASLHTPEGCTWLNCKCTGHIPILTYAETSVLEEMVLKSCSRKECAQSLQLGVKTVETHLFSIYQKLGVHTQLQLMALVFKAHVFELDELPDFNVNFGRSIRYPIKVTSASK